MKIQDWIVILPIHDVPEICWHWLVVLRSAYSRRSQAAVLQILNRKAETPYSLKSYVASAYSRIHPRNLTLVIKSPISSHSPSSPCLRLAFAPFALPRPSRKPRLNLWYVTLADLAQISGAVWGGGGAVRVFGLVLGCWFRGLYDLRAFLRARRQGSLQPGRGGECR